VPARNRVGEENMGWYVATTTLDFERSSIGTSVGLGQVVDGIIDWAKQHADDPRSTLSRNPVARAELLDRYIEAKVALMFSYRVVDLQNRGIIPNYEASMAKLFTTELTQRIYRTAMKVTGLYGQIWDRESDWA